MKKVFFAMMAVAMLTSCRFDVTRTISQTPESGETEYRHLKGFERIVLMGSMDVKYIQADSFSVKVSAPGNVIKDVETTVEKNTLKINMKNANRFINFGRIDRGPIIVYVTSPDFLGISLMGSGDFMSLRPLDTDTLSIDLKGSGDIVFTDVICDRVNVSLIGSGDVKVDNVKTQQARLNLVGSGDIDMHFENSGEVDSQVKGSGDITLSGTVKKMNQLVRGSGDINTGSLVVR